ncbi:MAG TPA: L,D-transpeptidase family protein [Gaiellaceae bacterium]|nr:L,D-transpeptidase family protein [Gaiellaceae bacterium]
MRGAPWILALAVLTAGCSGAGKHEAKAPATTTTSASTSTSTEASSSAGAKPSRKVAAQPKPARRKERPQRARRTLPWQRDGMSRVVHVKVPRVAVYSSPSAKHAVLLLRKRDARGTPRTFLVRSMTRKWIHVYLPSRPNGSQGWVRARAVRTYTNGYRIVVRLDAHRLFLWRGTKRIAAYPVAVGTPSTPTPRGLFYIVELLKPYDPNGSYGPYAFGLSAHSNKLKTFAGGDGRVGMHGTDQPGLIGTSVSHGCIRLRNAAIRRLAKILPLGTPVYVRG